MNEECSIQTEDTKVLNVPEKAELLEGSYNGEDSWDALVEVYKKENEKLKDQLALMKKDRPSIKPGTWNIPEHAGTFRNIPEHPGTSRNIPEHEKIFKILKK